MPHGEFHTVHGSKRIHPSLVGLQLCPYSSFSLGPGLGHANYHSLPQSPVLQVYLPGAPDSGGVRHQVQRDSGTEQLLEGWDDRHVLSGL